MSNRANGKWAKRRTRRIYCRLDTAMDQILGLKEVFEADHPEHCHALDTIAKEVLFAQEHLAMFYRVTWGRLPSNWYMDQRPRK